MNDHEGGADRRTTRKIRISKQFRATNNCVYKRKAISEQMKESKSNNICHPLNYLIKLSESIFWSPYFYYNIYQKIFL